MQVHLFLLIACIQAVTASNPSPSTEKEGSNTEKSKISSLSSDVMRTGDILGIISSFSDYLQLLKFGLVSKSFRDARKYWPRTVFQDAGLPYFGGANPTPEDWRLAGLIDGCMKGRFDQIFGPGSKVFPERPEYVKDVVERVANDSSICPEDKAMYFDQIGVFLCMKKRYDSLACLLSTVPLEFSSEMEWFALRMRHIPYELAKVDPSSMLRIVSTVDLELRVEIFTGILSIPTGGKLICDSLRFTRCSDSVRAALMAVGKSCLIPLAGFFIDSADAWGRNQELVRELSNLLPGGDQSQCSEYTYALLLNDIRFAPDVLSQENVLSRINLICNQSKNSRFRDVIGSVLGCAKADFDKSNRHVTEKIINFIVDYIVRDALVAAMYSHRHDLFKELWGHRSGLMTDEFTMAIKDFPEALECLSFKQCIALLGQDLDPRDKLKIIRSRKDFFAEHKDGLRETLCATHLIIEMELYTAEEFIERIQTSSTPKCDGHSLILEISHYLVGIVDELENLDLFVSVLVHQIRSFKKFIGDYAVDEHPVLQGSKNLLRALLSNRISDEQIIMLTEAMTERGFLIRPSLRCIYALLNDSALAEAMSTERGRLISNWISTEVLTGALGFDLSESQILRLFEIFQVPIHKSSFDFQGSVSAYTWLNENARTFGAMARSAANPGFMAHFAYSAPYTIHFRGDTERISEYYKTKNILEVINDRWPVECKFNIRFPYKFQSPPVSEDWRGVPLHFRANLSESSIAKNPLHFKSFGVLHLWFLHNYSNFIRFAPENVVRAFVPSHQNVSQFHNFLRSPDFSQFYDFSRFRNVPQSHDVSQPNMDAID